MTRDKSKHLEPHDIDERLIYRILTMYYIEEINQADIARQLKLSTAKVNRLIKQAKEQGLVEITVKMPSQQLFDLEAKLCALTQLREAFIVPTISDNSEAILQSIGTAASNFLLQNLRDGDTVCISGGKTMNAIVQQIEPRRSYDVRIVPATGARQGRYYTDVNNLATQLAEKLGGEAFQIHAPVLVDKLEEREALMSMRQISDILQMAREAQIALISVGSIIPNVSSYFDLMPHELLGDNWHEAFQESGAIGEVLAYVYDDEGQLCIDDLNNLVVGLTLDELRNIPLTIAVSAAEEKVLPIYGALRGNFIKSLVTDEQTVNSVINLYNQKG